MGILDPHLANDIDDTASELLRREDPEPMELMMAAMMGEQEEEIIVRR